ncbi:hypothetical protein MVES_003672 [Malassezia vespertilionis]|uniref:Uncharacterized protein n=1 Tax=Malassezia vespertilionis TaxID=2020962 RepID=A0A2N1J736_9BASI|nr:hypothetical protein MVES_003672 [Malassezia vespertilionis]
MPRVHTLWAFQAQPVTRERRHRSQRGSTSHEPWEHFPDDIDDIEHGATHDGTADSRPTSDAPQAHMRHASILAEQAEDRRWLRSTNVVARAGSTQHTAELRTQLRIFQEAHRAARGEHLPWRGEVAENARLLRVLRGLPPLGTSADADQLSDWEEAFEHAKMQRVRYGEKDIVQIGKQRTLLEEEMSHHEDEIQRHLAMGFADPFAPSDSSAMLHSAGEWADRASFSTTTSRRCSTGRDRACAA